MLVVAGKKSFERSWGHARPRASRARSTGAPSPTAGTVLTAGGQSDLRPPAPHRRGRSDQSHDTTAPTAATRPAPRLSAGAGGVIREVSEAKLLGRGGAAFPTAQVGGRVARGRAHRYLVANADESEPGTFKDRV